MWQKCKNIYYIIHFIVGRKDCKAVRWIASYLGSFVQYGVFPIFRDYLEVNYLIIIYNITHKLC